MTFQFIAGPCTMRAYDETDTIARDVIKAGATVLKGGAFKPLTWPPSMRQEYQVEPKHDGVAWLHDIAVKRKMPWMSEATDEVVAGFLAERPGVRIQIGARNQQNFSLLRAVGRLHTPVMLKRHFGCSLEELYASACYLLEFGSPDVWVCERGVVAPHQHGYRFLLDFQGVKEWTRLHPDIPIMVDVSHWQGSAAAKRGHVWPNTLWAAKAAKASGASGIYVDVHPDPPNALVDPYQAITPDRFAQLVRELS